jgi:hypothetical protein
VSAAAAAARYGGMAKKRNLIALEALAVGRARA